MGLKAVTTVGVRVLGLMSLFKGLMTLTSVLMITCAQSGSRAALGSVMSSIGTITVFYVVAGILCLAYSKALARVLTAGVEEAEAPNKPIE